VQIATGASIFDRFHRLLSIVASAFSVYSKHVGGIEVLRDGEQREVEKQLPRKSRKWLRRTQPGVVRRESSPGIAKEEQNVSLRAGSFDRGRDRGVGWLAGNSRSGDGPGENPFAFVFGAFPVTSLAD